MYDVYTFLDERLRQTKMHCMVLYTGYATVRCTHINPKTCRMSRTLAIALFSASRRPLDGGTSRCEFAGRLVLGVTRAWDLTSRPHTVKKIAASTSALSTMMMTADELPTSTSDGATVDVENPASDCSAVRLPADKTGSFIGDATVT